jgi:uncharacterized protein (TIGR00369 family)
VSTDFIVQAMPLCGTLGIRAAELTKDRVVLELDHAPELCTSGGVLHGGALMALADSAGATLAFLNLPDGAKGTATISSTTNFLSAMTGGTARATAIAVKVGARVITVRTDVTNDDRLVATVVQTQVVS